MNAKNTVSVSKTSSLFRLSELMALVRDIVYNTFSSVYLPDPFVNPYKSA